VIEGYQRYAGRWVTVDDSWYGQSDVAVSALTGGTYQGTGTWSHTYFTRRPPWPVPPLVAAEVRFPWEIWQRVVVEAKAGGGQAGGRQAGRDGSVEGVERR
jgi:hypothetical protein